MSKEIVGVFVKACLLCVTPKWVLHRFSESRLRRWQKECQDASLAIKNWV